MGEETLHIDLQFLIAPGGCEEHQQVVILERVPAIERLDVSDMDRKIKQRGQAIHNGPCIAAG